MPIKIALIYALIGFIWIFASDTILSVFFDNPNNITRLQTIKGWLFVFTSSVLIFLLVYGGTKKLRNEKNLVSKITETSPTAILLLDPYGKIRYVNKKFLELFKIDKEDIIGKDYNSNEWELKDFEGNKFLENELPFDRVKKTRKTVLNRRILITSNKISKYTSINAGPVFNENNEFKGVILIMEDITNKKKAQDRLEKYQENLELLVSSRTKELESLVHSVSHDLRAPLRSMEGFSNALLEDNYNELNEEGKDYVKRIKKSAKHMDNLILDLLDYSRLSMKDLKLKDIKIKNVLEDVLDNLKPYIEEKKGEIKIQEDLPVVKGNYSTLVQVFTNLISNGLKFVEDGKVPIIKINAKRKNNIARIIFQDNGIGIDPSYKNKIFNMFERLHGTESYPGTGVGLAVVKRGIERINGKVGVDSFPNQGSSFWVELPISEGSN